MIAGFLYRSVYLLPTLIRAARRSCPAGWTQCVSCLSFWFSEPLRQSCCWHLPQLGLAELWFALPHAGRGRAFEEAALACFWTGLSSRKHAFKLWPACFPHGMYVHPDCSPCNSTNVFWALQSCFALSLFNCVFPGIWFPEALTKDNPGS